VPGESVSRADGTKKAVPGDEVIGAGSEALNVN